MIPKNIGKDHIFSAVRDIDRDGIPPSKDSKKFKLFFEGKEYPPKYVISIANKYANGKELEPSDFSGGQETNNYLRQLGFEITEICLSPRRPQPQFNLRTNIDLNPSLARIIIADEWYEVDIDRSKLLLREICNAWPRRQKVNCLITCGGFLQFDWPDGLSLSDIGDNKFPKEESINRLIAEAKKQCDLLIDDELKKELIACTEYITIGIDSFMDKESTSETQPHVELVALINLKTRQYHWTGKSYPLTSQEKGLVRIKDLRTHFVDLPFGKVMILGCHDLNMFSPRGNAVVKAGWRKEIIHEMEQKVAEEKPKIVLQHPHTTDSPNIWTQAWNKLAKTTSTIEKYVSAGRYYYRDGARSDLDKVLIKTKRGSTIDFIVSIVE
jgi:hypothetical protein